MITHATNTGRHEIAEGFAVARGFLFRVPSEMCPLLHGHFTPGRHSGIVFNGQEAIVTLGQRKHKALPVEIKRTCVCAQQGRRLCCVHQLERAVNRARAAGRPSVFSFSYAQFLDATKTLAAEIGIQRAGTHAFRRGTAQDVAAQGCQLYEILRAGGWKSRSIMDYMRPHELETGACAQLIADHSDSE